jgi:hypothetical protein
LRIAPGGRTSLVGAAGWLKVSNGTVLHLCPKVLTESRIEEEYTPWKFRVDCEELEEKLPRAFKLLMPDNQIGYILGTNAGEAPVKQARIDSQAHITVSPRGSFFPGQGERRLRVICISSAADDKILHAMELLAVSSYQREVGTPTAPRTVTFVVPTLFAQDATIVDKLQDNFESFLVLPVSWSSGGETMATFTGPLSKVLDLVDALLRQTSFVFSTLSTEEYPGQPKPPRTLLPQPLDHEVKAGKLYEKKHVKGARLASKKAAKAHKQRKHSHLEQAVHGTGGHKRKGSAQGDREQGGKKQKRGGMQDMHKPSSRHLSQKPKSGVSKKHRGGGGPGESLLVTVRL